MLTAVVHPASVQDRDGAVLVLDERTRRLFPFLETIFADSAYGGPKLQTAIAGAGWKIEVVKRPADQTAVLIMKFGGMVFLVPVFFVGFRWAIGLIGLLEAARRR